MRIALSVSFVVLTLILIVCAFISFRSKKKIGKKVGHLLLSLALPVMGNLWIIASPNETLSTIGCYTYFIGMDLVMLTMFAFMYEYCNITFHNKLIKSIVYSLLLLDAIQLLLNLAFNHAFIMIPAEKYDSVFYTFEALTGQLIHRIVDYVILGSIMVVFLVKTIRTPRVYSERYLVVLLAMIAVGIWQSINMFNKSPINIAMLGYGVYGVLIFLLTIYYRPLRLLDRMLGAIAAKMPESIFFFDTNRKCIWLNEKAATLLGISSNQLENIPELLKEKLGDFEKTGDDWESVVSFGNTDNFISYVIERHAVIDDNNHFVGSYLSVRDDSETQRSLQRETYNATHDALTKLLNRAGYDAALKEVDLDSSFLLLIDLDAFKEANDKCGHNIGDKVLVRIAETIKKHFREEDYVCRIGGDEFAVIIPNVKNNIAEDVKRRIDNINKELLIPVNDLPCITISAGGAYGKEAENFYELLNNADHAMYVTKFGGKCGFSLYEKR